MNEGDERLFNWDENTPLREKVGNALGLASMCWEHPERAGVFDSELASRVIDELMAELEKANDAMLTRLRADAARLPSLMGNDVGAAPCNCDECLSWVETVRTWLS